VELALVVFCVNKGGDNAVDSIVLGATTRNAYSTTAALVTFHYLWIVESQITHSPPIGILRVLGERKAAKTAYSLSPCLESAEVHVTASGRAASCALTCVNFALLLL
jgi:hypothetical protein